MTASALRWIAPQDGFTLLEIMVAMTIFAAIVIGAAGLLAPQAAGGFLATSPTAAGATQVAKDLTAASMYLQAVAEFLAGRTDTIPASGTYCLGEGCDPQGAFAGISFPPLPSGPTQLHAARLLVDIQRWQWNPVQGRYCPVGPECMAASDDDYLTRVRATLTWRTAATARTLTVERSLP